LNDAPTFTEAGLDTETLLTLTSEDARILVDELFDPLLFPGVGSDTWSWSTVADAPTEKLCADGFVHVTDHEAGAPTVVGAEVATDVFCTVCGFDEDVVQSPGSVSVNDVSTFAGDCVPLL
jgi:hypothetical protein